MISVPIVLLIATFIVSVISLIFVMGDSISKARETLIYWDREKYIVVQIKPTFVQILKHLNPFRDKSAPVVSVQPSYTTSFAPYWDRTLRKVIRPINPVRQ